MDLQFIAERRPRQTNPAGFLNQQDEIGTAELSSAAKSRSSKLFGNPELADTSLTCLMDLVSYKLFFPDVVYLFGPRPGFLRGFVVYLSTSVVPDCIQA